MSSYAVQGDHFWEDQLLHDKPTYNKEAFNSSGNGNEVAFNF